MKIAPGAGPVKAAGLNVNEARLLRQARERIRRWSPVQAAAPWERPEGRERRLRVPA
jgi:hypothetical protein